MNFYAAHLTMKDEEKNKEFRPAHLEFLEKMHAERKVIFYGRFTDGSGGLVIYRAASLEEAISYAEQDPYIIEGARDCVVREWAMVTDIDLQLD